MEEMKLTFTVVDMNIYVENTKAVIKKLLKLISNYYRNIVRYKVKRQKSIAFLYTSNEHKEFKIKTQYHFHSIQKLRCIGINITK